MDTTLRPRSPRGVDLLLEHCAALVYSDENHPDEARLSPFERVEAAVGWELAHRLLQALSGDHVRVPRHLLV
jgi:hypothetical protein